MTLIEIFLIGVGLSMDAFAVAICKGLSYSGAKAAAVSSGGSESVGAGSLAKSSGIKLALIPGFYFGLFQALMPIIGFLVGDTLKGTIEAYDHWVAFVLLAFIGIGMIREAGKEAHEDPDMGPKAMLPLAVATSIDALTVGVSLGIMNANIWLSALIIGITTLVISSAGFWLGSTLATKAGSALGEKYKSGAEILGGIILILIGLKILLEHLGILVL